MRASRSTRSQSCPSLVTTVSSFVVALVILAGHVAHATPPMLEPKQALDVPPDYEDITDLAIDGNFLVMAARRDRQVGAEDIVTDGAVFLFTRASNGTWQYTQTLFTGTHGPGQPLTVALRGNIVAVHFGQLSVFERNAAGVWLSSPIDRPSENPTGNTATIYDTEIDAGTILLAGPCLSNQYSVRALRKNASGVWFGIGTAESAGTSCREGTISDVAMSGNTMIMAAQLLTDGSSADYVFEGPPQSWTLTQTLAGNTRPATIDGDFAVLGRAGNPGPAPGLYQRISGVWTLKQNIERADRFLLGPVVKGELRSKLAVLAYTGTPSVWQGDANNTYREFARLTLPGGGVIGPNTVDLSGRRIVINDIYTNKAYVYEVPTSSPQPATVQDTFNSGSFSRWTPIAGSLWTVATTPTSRVFRQSSVAGDAGAVLGNSDWTDQSIQVDVKPTAFSGTDRWFGMAVRRTDAANYYYVTARQTNVIQLKKIVNGAFSTLASTSLPVTLNRAYRLRLEAIGTTIRVLVNGRVALQVADKSLKHGSAALLMFKTAADYDNAIATPSPQVLLVDDTFEQFNGFRWKRVSGQWTVTSEANPKYVQSSAAGNATLLTGTPTTDQSIEALATPNSFATDTERWFGVFTRWRDPSNYYYVTLRNTNEISLRKLVNGTIQVLGSTKLKVTQGVAYRVRLEAIKDQLRVYVNGVLLLEATDSSYASGRYGLVMFNAATTYNDVLVTQP
jgi:hypothetical protein